VQSQGAERTRLLKVLEGAKISLAKPIDVFGFLRPADAASRDRQQAKPIGDNGKTWRSTPHSNGVRRNIEKPKIRDSNWEKEIRTFATISMDQARFFLPIFQVRDEPTAQPPSQLFYLDQHLAV